MLSAAHRLVQQLGQVDPITQQFLTAAADTAPSRWQEKDQGIWEIRGAPRDFLYSKLMCWAALDCAIDIAPQLNAQHRAGEWAAARDEIRAAILEQRWSDTGPSPRPENAAQAALQRRRPVLGTRPRTGARPARSPRRSAARTWTRRT